MEHDTIRYINIFVRLEEGPAPGYKQRHAPNSGWDHMDEYYNYLSLTIRQVQYLGLLFSVF
uniref:Uncharacterized protein n=1 Tax=Caenorhabditis japonica TaxID=281687 RepID=A0A8R1EVE0_CAEJA